MHHKVLACVDHSSYSSGVCDYAAWAAMRLNAPLEFIHVLARHPETAQKRDLSGSIGLGAQEALLADLAAFDEKRSKIAMKSGRLLLEGARQRAVSSGVASPEIRQRHGELVETLAGMEADARLFVLGKRGEAAEHAPQHLGGNLKHVVRAIASADPGGYQEIHRTAPLPDRLRSQRDDTQGRGNNRLQSAVSRHGLSCGDGRHAFSGDGAASCLGKKHASQCRHRGGSRCREGRRCGKGNVGLHQRKPD